jgi:23S rRNA (adenine-N6)-dimethyltransferase
VSAEQRTSRGERRRQLGQNFLRSEFAEHLVDRAAFGPGDFVVEVGPGLGAFTAALARRGVRVLAVELDAGLARKLPARLGPGLQDRVRVVSGDFLSCPLPEHPFRVLGSIPFARTTEILRRLLEDPRQRLVRADLVVQWEVARKRAARPPSTLLSAIWAPWWEFELVCRIPAREFAPIPHVDAGLVTVVRRREPLLPIAMAGRYARFVRAHWPFDARPSASRRR